MTKIEMQDKYFYENNLTKTFIPKKLVCLRKLIL